MTLRELTQENHKKAESMPFNQKLLKGELTQWEYGEYLKSQLAIFSTIEGVFKLPDPGMCREDSILSDLEELFILRISTDSPATREYCEYLKNLDHHLFMPHVYLNYMALMMGGQILKKLVPGSGKMYDFGNAETVRKYVSLIRDEQNDLEWADEVNKGYEFVIAIYNELQ